MCCQQVAQSTYPVGRLLHACYSFLDKQLPKRSAPLVVLHKAHKKEGAGLTFMKSADMSRVEERGQSATWRMRSGSQGRLLPSNFSPSEFTAARDEFSISTTGSSAVFAPLCLWIASLKAFARCSTYSSAASNQSLNYTLSSHLGVIRCLTLIVSAQHHIQTFT